MVKNSLKKSDGLRKKFHKKVTVTSPTFYKLNPPLTWGRGQEFEQTNIQKFKCSGRRGM